MGNGNNGNSKRKTSLADGERKRDTNLETESTAIIMAVILEHMRMVNKKVKNTTTVTSTSTEKMGKQRKIRLKGWFDLHDGTMADV